MLQSLLYRWKSLSWWISFLNFFAEPTGTPPTRPLTHTIPLLPGTQPFRLKPYRYTPFQKDEIERQVAQLLKSNMIKESTSPFASPALLVKKKNEEWLLCVDYRRLNAYTVTLFLSLKNYLKSYKELNGSLPWTFDLGFTKSW
jgi:hypothetical protein